MLLLYYGLKLRAPTINEVEHNTKSQLFATAVCPVCNEEVVPTSKDNESKNKKTKSLCSSALSLHSHLE